MTQGELLPQIEMPRYKCHKEVWALKISKVHTDEDGWGLVLTFEDANYPPRAFTRDQLERKPKPQPGWYLVVYDSSYFSFSPAKEFEEGYTRL